MPLPLEYERDYALQAFDRKAGRFALYTGGQSFVWETGHRNVPSAALDHFEAMSQRFIDPSAYRPLDFHLMLRIGHPRKDLTTWAAWQTKATNNLSCESNVYLVDATTSGNYAGHGEIRYDFSSQESFFSKKPFVGYNTTAIDYVHQGLGTARLITMNALTQMLYGLPLHSDTLIHRTPRQDGDSTELHLWDHLVHQGLARRYRQDGKLRFAFLPQQDLFLRQLRP